MTLPKGVPKQFARPSSESESQSLERFVNLNPELEDLENILGRFNLFEAVGAVHSELRHSDFLAFLLNPRETHGLSDTFLKLFLKRACTGGAVNCELNPIEVDVWDMKEMIVKREWEGVDILLVHEPKKTVCWIENKIGSKEHSDQLTRYYNKVGEKFPGFRRVPIYLTPDGSIPSNTAYLPMDYGLVVDVLNSLDSRLIAKEYGVHPDFRVAIRHYSEMLGRYIVIDSKVAQLAREIYQKHSKALDIIFEHRPDLQLSIFENLKKLIEARDELKMDKSSKAFIRFYASSWDSKKDFLSGSEEWIPSKRLFLFEFKNFEDSLALYLIIGPGDSEVRSRVYSACQSEKGVFPGGSKNLSEKWTTVWKMPILAVADYERHPGQDLFTTISMKWSNFLGTEFPKIERVLSKCLEYDSRKP